MGSQGATQESQIVEGAVIVWWDISNDGNPLLRLSLV